MVICSHHSFTQEEEQVGDGVDKVSGRVDFNVALFGKKRALSSIKTWQRGSINIPLPVSIEVESIL